MYDFITSYSIENQNSNEIPKECKLVTNLFLKTNFRLEKYYFIKIKILFIKILLYQAMNIKVNQ